MKNFNYIFLAFTIFLYSCHSSEDYRHSRRNMHIDCQTIEQELNILYGKQQQIDNMDKFSFSNMLVIPAIIRTIKITTQRTEIEQKLNQYRNLKISKGCSENNRSTQRQRSNNYHNSIGQNYNDSYSNQNYYNQNNNMSYNDSYSNQNYNNQNLNYQNNHNNSYNNYQNYNAPSYNQQNNSYPYYQNSNQNTGQPYGVENNNFMGFGSDPIASQYLKQFR